MLHEILAFTSYFVSQNNPQYRHQLDENMTGKAFSREGKNLSNFESKVTSHMPVFSPGIPSLLEYPQRCWSQQEGVEFHCLCGVEGTGHLHQSVPFMQYKIHLPQSQGLVGFAVCPGNGPHYGSSGWNVRCHLLIVQLTLLDPECFPSGILVPIPQQFSPCQEFHKARCQERQLGQWITQFSTSLRSSLGSKGRARSHTAYHLADQVRQL